MLKRINSPTVRRNPLRNASQMLDCSNLSRSLPLVDLSPQISSESAADLILLPDSLSDVPPVDDSWQTALSRRSAWDTSQSSQASRTMLKTAALTAPVISVIDTPNMK